jgi:hypothetical protein
LVLVRIEIGFPGWRISLLGMFLEGADVVPRITFESSRGLVQGK